MKKYTTKVCKINKSKMFKRKKKSSPFENKKSVKQGHKSGSIVN